MNNNLVIAIPKLLAL